MQSDRSPTTPRGQTSHSVTSNIASPSSSTHLPANSPPSNMFASTSPMRFATSTNAFGLTASPTSSSSSRDGSNFNANLHPGSTSSPSYQTLESGRSPPSAGTVTTKRLRRPSLLSLAQTASFSSQIEKNDIDVGESLPEPTEANSTTAGTSSSKITDDSITTQSQSQAAWNPFGLGVSRFQRTSSASSLPMEGLKASTPPIRQSVSMELEGSGSASPMDLEGESGQSEVDNDSRSPLRWAPSHLQTSSSRRKGKGRMDDLESNLPAASSGNIPLPNQLHGPPFTGRPIPASLLATLISESRPLKHEMESEARLQRFLSSHPSALPLTPRAPRSSRGRFPEMVGGEDDDDDNDLLRRSSSWGMRSWLGGRAGSTTDSDSDDMLGDDNNPDPEPVNAAFAAGMDMERPTSSSSTTMWNSANSIDQGKLTPGQGQPTPPSATASWSGTRQGGRMSFSAAGMGMVPSPGTGFALPSAFGSLGMGGHGGITPLGSPTVERLEVGDAQSASYNSSVYAHRQLVGSPNTSLSSPGLMQYRDPGSSASLRPGKRKAQNEDRFDPYKRPRGSSPSFSGYPMSPSRSSAIPIPQSPGHASLFASNYQLSTSNPSRRPNHPYSRPMVSRSRAASPALSIGSTSGVLSTSIGNGQKGFGLGGPFVPTNQGALNAQQALGQNSLGGLGLLSLANVGEIEEVEEAESGGPFGENGRNNSEDAMEED